MYKWKNIASSLQKTTLSVNDNTNGSMLNQLILTKNENCKFIPPVAQEIEIDSCNESKNIKPSVEFKTDHISDSYNGAIRENYIWTQTLNDLDVLVKLPDHIKASKDTIKINISSNEIKIDGKLSSSEDTEWENIFSGKLSFKIRRDESIWSYIEAGTQISVRSYKIHSI